MNIAEKKILLDIARKSVESAIKGTQANTTEFETDSIDLRHEKGVFVTLRTHGKLRGCIGRLISNAPLPKLVSEMAASAVLDDTRFLHNRLQKSDLADLRIEISILSPLKKLNDPLDFELGKHGIYIRKHHKNGCFLPQVAAETGWSKEEFLSQCCQAKAGLPPEAWRDKDTELYIFTAETIS